MQVSPCVLLINASLIIVDYQFNDFIKLECMQLRIDMDYKMDENFSCEKISNFIDIHKEIRKNTTLFEVL